MRELDEASSLDYMVGGRFCFITNPSGDGERRSERIIARVVKVLAVQAGNQNIVVDEVDEKLKTTGRIRSFGEGTKREVF